MVAKHDTKKKQNRVDIL